MGHREIDASRTTLCFLSILPVPVLGEMGVGGKITPPASGSEISRVRLQITFKGPRSSPDTGRSPGTWAQVLPLPHTTCSTLTCRRKKC